MMCVLCGRMCKCVVYVLCERRCAYGVFLGVGVIVVDLKVEIVWQLNVTVRLGNRGKVGLSIKFINRCWGGYKMMNARNKGRRGEGGTMVMLDV